MDISVIIPAYNESDNIDILFHTLDEYFSNCDFSAECIFVNDGSKDDTLIKMKMQKPQNFNAKIVNLSKNSGSHAAIRAGCQIATGEYTMFLGADLQEPVELIGRVLSKFKNDGNDKVYVVRGKTQRRLSERLFSNIFHFLIKKYAVHEMPKGDVFNIGFSKKVRDSFNNNIQKNSSIFLQLIEMGFSHSIIEQSYGERKIGKSKWTYSAKVKLFIDSFVNFSYFPIRLISIIGVLFAIFGFLYAIYIIVIRIFNIFPMDVGWATLISIISIGFGVTNISLGIIAEYLWRTMDSTKKQPLFIINEVVEL